MSKTCIDCFDNCPDGQPISDRCVKYTGDDIACLGICNGDSLYEVEVQIANKLCAVLDGTGIDLSALDVSCDFLVTILNGKDKNLANLMQMLITASCTLKSLIDGILTQINASFTIVAPCLTIPANPTLAQVFQAIATKLCEVDTRVTAIEVDYVKNTELCAKVAVCIAGSTSTQFNTRMVPYVAYPYHGPLANFDAGGTGILANNFDKIYLCVGQTIGSFALPDYRGRSPIGANTGVPGGALDAAVDPGLPANTGYAIVNKTKKGNYTNTLTVLQEAPHTHTVTDPGHTHGYYTILANGGGVGSGLANDHSHQNESIPNATTASAVTGISIASAGGGQPHDNTHPVMGCSFIMHIP